MILSLVDEAVHSGARLRSVCHELGLSVKTIQRWRKPGGGEDGRHGPRTVPANKLSVEERQEILETVNSAEWRDLSPNQIVPRLADQEIYLASESTMYRLLREHKQLVHRERSRPAKSRRPNEQEATGPHQLWSWDITYLRGPVRGSFYYLYMIEDVWSRKIVGWQIHEKESPELAASLFKETCAYLKLDPDGLVLHSDNGGPMKGSTMLATLQKLGVVASFSRPHVSDDNPYSEAALVRQDSRLDASRNSYSQSEANKNRISRSRSGSMTNLFRDNYLDIHRYQRRSVAGVATDAIWASASRPKAWALTASLRRSSSERLRRLPRSPARSTRFSSCR